MVTTYIAFRYRLEVNAIPSELYLVSYFDCKDHSSSCFCYSCKLHLMLAIWLHIKAVVLPI